jgi:hypothetical protein
MEFETWDDLETAFVGGFGSAAKQEAEAMLQECLDGGFGSEAQVAYDEFTNDLVVGLENGDIQWQDGGPVENSEEDLLAAAERVVTSEEIERVAEEDRRGDRVEAVEKSVGRVLTSAEEDRLINDDLVDLRAFTEELKGKRDTAAGREEIMDAAWRRAKAEDGEPFDQEKYAAEFAGMSEEDQRAEHMQNVFVMAKGGHTFDDSTEGAEEEEEA